MPATIKIKNSSTASAVPTSSDLVQGELAVNVTDKRIFTENASGTVVELGTNPSILTLPDGSASAPTLTNDGDTNTGIFFPAADTVGISTGGTERARVDSSGNLGLGVTPSAWSGFKAIDLQGGGAIASYTASPSIQAVNNAYFDGTNWRYKTSTYASRYIQDSGAHSWYYTASGTAGQIPSFTQAMTLDASGQLGLGVTSPISLSGYHGLTLSGSTGGFIRIQNDAGTQNAQIAANNSGLEIECVNTGIPMKFYTGGSERARIDSSGNLLVGTTGTNVGAGSGSVYYGGTSAGIIYLYRGAGTQQVRFIVAGTEVGGITTTSSSTSYATSSDYRLKENIQPMTGALARVATLKPVTYKWKVDGADGEGFIAHELAEVCPNAVNGEKDAIDEDGNPKYQGIDTSFLVATLTAAIQELKAIVDEQAAEIAALKGQA